MLFIKYAPEQFQRLMKLIYFVAALFCIVSMYKWDKYYSLKNPEGTTMWQSDAWIFIGIYILLNLVLNYSFKPIVKKYSKSFIIPFSIEIIFFISFGLLYQY